MARKLALLYRQMLFVFLLAFQSCRLHPGAAVLIAAAITLRAIGGRC